MEAPKQSRIAVLVEDSDDDAYFFERALAQSGVSVQFVRVPDGGAAVEYLQRVSSLSRDISQSHVLFLDLKLPVLSGFEVLKWIRESDLILEVIILSGSDLDTDIEEARVLGASEFLVKPISATQLRDRLPPIPADISASRNA